jgi:hypothetical protein
VKIVSWETPTSQTAGSKVGALDLSELHEARHDPLD